MALITVMGECGLRMATENGVRWLSVSDVMLGERKETNRNKTVADALLRDKPDEK